MESSLRAGLAVYNAGDYHEAHDAWEDHWLDLPEGTDDERFLHGLIQFTAAVHHAHERQWGGATGLADSAREYLDGLGPTHRGVALAPVREFLTALAADPELVERRHPPTLTHGGEPPTLSTLDFPAAAVAAAVYAEAGPYDEAVLEQAIEYARADLDAGEETSDFVTFVLDFARDAEHRGIVLQRLGEHVDRRARRDADVDGLFD
ncbi:DUF309 domain-containing protein [Halorientalis litorea]|uniref:DUF309 domain-containing protein n=1 Tax=Halorientalis litorea TaxID=2931977 RepID=UPI001FF687FB|nr:DUF309 domain-containing protein [Halorientalis litorea]